MIEADKCSTKLLGKLGFTRKKRERKNSGRKAGPAGRIEELRDIRDLYHKIVEDPGHEASLEEIRSALAMYERFFRGMELID